jgi:hypothetical protein
MPFKDNVMSSFTLDGQTWQLFDVNQGIMLCDKGGAF